MLFLHRSYKTIISITHFQCMYSANPCTNDHRSVYYIPYKLFVQEIARCIYHHCRSRSGKWV